MSAAKLTYALVPDRAHFRGQLEWEAEAADAGQFLLGAAKFILKAYLAHEATAPDPTRRIAARAAIRALEFTPEAMSRGLPE